MKRWTPFLLGCAALVACLTFADRYFLKLNDGFCLRNIMTILPSDQERETSLSPEEDLGALFAQEFHYLAKGHQSYAFISADGKTVIKFYRFPSHLRPFPWLNHPLSAHFSKRRQQIMEYNLEKLDLTFNSYKLAFEELKEETDLIWIHLTPSGNWNQKLTLVDRTQNRYTVALDPLCFVVQKRVERIFPALACQVAQEDREGAKQLIESLCQLIAQRARKGIQDADALIEKNYGWNGERVVNIDVGRFVREPLKERLSELVHSIAFPLENWLQMHDSELLTYYYEQIENIR